MRRKLKNSIVNALLWLLPTKRIGHFWSQYWMGRIDFRVIVDKWWSLPFNGQAVRLRNFFYIGDIFNPTVGLETGTFIGSSTYLFGGMRTIKQVFSMEFSRDYFEIAKFRWESNLVSTKKEFHFVLGDSSLLINDILHTLDRNTDRLLCYLDAHWESEVPTRNELVALSSWGGYWIAIIDDFEVPYSPISTFQYGFDKYESSKIDASLVSGLESCSLYFPTTLAAQETGNRRGTGYVFSHKALTYFTEEMFEKLEIRPLEQF